MLLEAGHRSPLLERDIAPYVTDTWAAIRACDFTGYDPGSFRGGRGRRLFRSGRSPFARRWNAVLKAVRAAAGYSGVRLEGVPRVTSTKAIALSTSALVALARAGEREAALEAAPLVDRLLGLRDPSTGLWNVDFEYSVRGASVPRGQIGVINSVFSAAALDEWHRVTGDARASEAVVQTADAIVRHLPMIRRGSQVAFTYNPSTRYYVHNSNAFIAALLCRAAELDGGRGDLVDLAAGCVRYVLDDLDHVGVLRYAGEPTPNGMVDNYHTGYVLRALDGLRETAVEARVGALRLDRAIRDLHRFYMATFVSADRITKHPGGRYVHAHSLAEALLVYARFAGRGGFAVPERFPVAAAATFDQLWDARRGYFINAVWRLPPGLRRRDVTPMVRWSWSWMLLALARVVELERAQRSGSAPVAREPVRVEATE
jgi:hypothetical protein